MGTRKRNRRAIVLVHGLLITALIVALGACSTDGADPIAVEGTWVLDTGYYERWIITENSITYEGSSDGSEYTTNYEAKIVSHSNNGLNAGETKLTGNDTEDALNPGFAVIEYTEVDGPGTGEVGKFNLFRWADNADDPSNKDFSQGYKDATPNDDENFDTVVFDTPAEAEAEVTVANEFFENPPSSGAVKQ
ncbi:MAG: hypothetical protein ACLFNP_08345 [Spirochaetaceae bacterium]